jgi:RNA polymerase primary sigma factor
LSYNKLCILLDADKSTISLDSPPPHSDESESRSLGDTLEDHLTQPPDCIAQIKSDNNILNLCLRKLNHRERTIIEYRFGLRNKEFETLESIGVRFKVTRERIRQIEESALKKLRFWIKKYKIK